MGLLKTFRLLRLLRVARRLDQYSQYAPAVVLLLMCGFTLAAHWFACMWYAIGEHERPEKSTYGWLDQLSNDVAQPYKVSVCMERSRVHIIFLIRLQAFKHKSVSIFMMWCGIFWRS